MRFIPLVRRHIAPVVLMSSVLFLVACSDQPEGGGPGADMKVPVSVIEVQPKRVEISADLPGRVDAIKDAQIRARVTGIVETINFEQGSDVAAGDVLFTIDPASYAAAQQSAAAELKRAQADAQSARLLAQRYSRLIKAKAISQQDYDNAQAAAAQADAQVEAAKARLRSADIDLGYTEVTSPIDGRVGEAFVTEGALVSATEASLMATVQNIDEVYVDLNRSTAELSALRKALAQGQLQQLGPDEARAYVLLEDGTEYSEPGRLLFSGIAVDPTTGTVRLRAIFPNPDNILLPGMYVRVRLPQGIDEKALMVPQQALQRSADGGSNLVLVKDGKAAPVPVGVGSVVNGQYVITEGLNPGDTVIVAGFQKIRPGAPVQPIPWKAGAAADQAPAAPDTQGQSPQAQGQSPGDASKGGPEPADASAQQ